MQILFHLMANTGCLPDKVVPQIPTNRMKGEDQETPRICTGHTLDDCLTGIGIPHFIPFSHNGKQYEYPVILDSQWSSIPMQPAPEFRKCLLDITKKWLEEE